MYKNAMRNMQRAGLKTGTGLLADVAQPEPPLPTVQQARLSEAARLARIRRAFEIETEIADLLRRGQGVAALRTELAAVRAGKQDVPLSLARYPSPSPDHVAVTVHRKRGPERTTFEDRRQPEKPRPEKKKPLSSLAVEADLSDLSKEKVTLSGVAIVKILLIGFDVDTIALTLKTPAAFLEKIRSSHLFSLAPTLETEDALVVVDVLEKRLMATFTASEKVDSIGKATEVELIKRNPKPFEPLAQEIDVAQPAPRTRQPMVTVKTDSRLPADTPPKPEGTDKSVNFLRKRKTTYIVVKAEGEDTSKTLDDADSSNGLRLTNLLGERRRLQAALEESLMISRNCRENIKKVNAEIALLRLR